MIKNLFIRKRTCENCYYSAFVTNLSTGEETLCCDFNKYAFHTTEVELNDCCREHIFRDGNDDKDIHDIQCKGKIKMMILKPNKERC